jgi:hypothetical protein
MKWPFEPLASLLSFAERLQGGGEGWIFPASF